MGDGSIHNKRKVWVWWALIVCINAALLYGALGMVASARAAPRHGRRR